MSGNKKAGEGKMNPKIILKHLEIVIGILTILISIDGIVHAMM